MAKHRQREDALKLRNKGFSYSQIRDKLHISKSTLSTWLRHLPLSKERMSELRDRNEHRIESFRNTMKVKRQAVIKQSFLKEKNAIGKFSKRDLNLIALALYWAEGTKTWDSKTEITNSDPKLLATFIRWMRAEGIAIERVKIALHLYVSMDVQHEITFWSTMLGIPQDQFYTPRIKSSSRVLHTGRNGHGTCQVIFGDRGFNDRVYAGIQHLSSLSETVK